MNFSKLKNDNPWGSYDNDKKPSRDKKSNDPNIEELLSNSQDFFKKLFGEKFSRLNCKLTSHI